MDDFVENLVDHHVSHVSQYFHPPHAPRLLEQLDASEVDQEFQKMMSCNSILSVANDLPPLDPLGDLSSSSTYSNPDSNERFSSEHLQNLEYFLKSICHMDMDGPIPQPSQPAVLKEFDSVLRGKYDEIESIQPINRDQFHNPDAKKKKRLCDKETQKRRRNKEALEKYILRQYVRTLKIQNNQLRQTLHSRSSMELN